MPLDHAVLGATFEDQDHAERHGAWPRSPTTPRRRTRFTYSGTYKVVFLAFPLEAYGTAAQKADLMTRTFAFFGP